MFAVCEFDRLRERLQQHIKTLPRQKNYNWKGVLGCAVMGTDMYWYRGHVMEVIGGHVKVSKLSLDFDRNALLVGRDVMIHNELVKIGYNM